MDVVWKLAKCHAVYGLTKGWGAGAVSPGPCVLLEVVVVTVPCFIRGDYGSCDP